MTEQNGGGVALLDFDADGRVDLYFANGSHFDHPAEHAGAQHALYRAAGELQYVEVGAAAHVNVSGFGMGVAAGDYDNDGFVDLFVAGYAEDRLWRNNGDGTYSEATLDPQRDPALWATSAAFADLDGDGFLDLYVVDYVDYGRDDAPCYTQHQPPVRISCGPLGRPGQRDRLYQNQANGDFRDASESSGIAIEPGKGLGASVADFDGDGRLDLYVANDTTRNFLFINRGDFRFEDLAVAWGCSVAADGRPTSGMGIGCADYNQDGRFDLFVTNFEGEPNDLYENGAQAGFRPRNTDLGLDSLFRPRLGFGVSWTDFDLDGYPDLMVANGHVWDLRPTGGTYDYAMLPQLLWNREGRSFADVSTAGGVYFSRQWLGRATAVGDLDADGDPDLVVSHLEQPAVILRNDSRLAAPGVRLRLIGRHSARTPLGTAVEWHDGAVTWTSRIPSGDSFQSSSSDRITIPAPGGQPPERITVHWAAGRSETWGVPADRVAEIVLIEGMGELSNERPPQ